MLKFGCMLRNPPLSKFLEPCSTEPLIIIQWFWNIKFHILLLLRKRNSRRHDNTCSQYSHTNTTWLQLTKRLFVQQNLSQFVCAAASKKSSMRNRVSHSLITLYCIKLWVVRYSTRNCIFAVFRIKGQAMLNRAQLLISQHLKAQHHWCTLN